LLHERHDGAEEPEGAADAVFGPSGMTLEGGEALRFG
jgi:hypothetical protein